MFFVATHVLNRYAHTKLVCIPLHNIYPNSHMFNRWDYDFKLNKLKDKTE